MAEGRRTKKRRCSPLAGKRAERAKAKALGAEEDDEASGRHQVVNARVSARHPRHAAERERGPARDFHAFLDGFSAALSTDSRVGLAQGAVPGSIGGRGGAFEASKGCGRSSRSKQQTAGSSGAPTLHFAAIRTPWSCDFCPDPAPKQRPPGPHHTLLPLSIHRRRTRGRNRARARWSGALGRAWTRGGGRNPWRRRRAGVLWIDDDGLMGGARPAVPWI